MKTPGKSPQWPPGQTDPLLPQQPLVSAQWLLRALCGILALAVICAYATLCLLFYQGQWQLIFHPSRRITTTPASLGLRYDEVQFDYTEMGTPQLDGWWIPAEPASRGSGQTILFLHDGRGSLSDTVAQLQALHTLGINAFAFDYRGFGRSVNVHPSEQRMNQDADAAWAYLTDTRHLPPRSMTFYGVGQGAVLAAEAARRHPSAAAVILDTPSLPALKMIIEDQRSKLLPVKLLLKDRFEPQKTLSALHTPKLFLDRAPAGSAMAEYGEILFRGAAPPKEIEGGDTSLETIRHFLNEHMKQ